MHLNIVLEDEEIENGKPKANILKFSLRGDNVILVTV